MKVFHCGGAEDEFIGKERARQSSRTAIVWIFNKSENLSEKVSLHGE
jgi:hypothetical protein